MKFPQDPSHGEKHREPSNPAILSLRTQNHAPKMSEATANKTMKTTKIKLQETQKFNMEINMKNLSNAKGKNYGRQPASTSLYRVCVYNA